MGEPVRTPDGRYLVIEGKFGPRLWRASNPGLSADERERLVKQLMHARRDVRDAKGDRQALAAARAAVDIAKRGLGERGEVWWTDGAPDQNRRLVRNSTYRDWWDGLAQRDVAARDARDPFRNIADLTGHWPPPPQPKG